MQTPGSVASNSENVADFREKPHDRTKNGLIFPSACDKIIRHLVTAVSCPFLGSGPRAVGISARRFRDIKADIPLPDAGQPGMNI